MIDYIKLKIAHELACKYSKETNLLCSVDVCFNGENITYHLYYGASEESHLADYHYTYSIEDLIAKLKELTQPKPKYEVGQEVYWIVSDVIYSGIIDCANPNENRWKIKIDDELVEIDECYLYPSREALIDAQIEYWTNLRTPTESKLCPKCGNKRVADGMCWQAMCDYLEDPVPIDKMTPPFEGNKIGFRCFDDEMEVGTCKHTWIGSKEGTMFCYHCKIQKPCEHESDGMRYATEEYPILSNYRCKKCGEFY